jgi:hypothetical protein
MLHPNWVEPRHADKVSNLKLARVTAGEKPEENLRRCGGRTRIRTLDPLIKSQLLYQLSYAP